jgi:iron complex transport system permease protein
VPTRTPVGPASASITTTALPGPDAAHTAGRLRRASDPDRPASSKPRPGTAAVRRAALLLLLGALAVTVLISLAVGSRSLPDPRRLQSPVRADDSETSAIVRELRLPRTAVGLVVGAALGLAGAQLQGLTRNRSPTRAASACPPAPASPSSAPARCWASEGRPGQVWAALVGALLATVAVWVLAGGGAAARAPCRWSWPAWP